MADRYGGLKLWQWAIVFVWATLGFFNSLSANAAGPAFLAGSVAGSLIGAYVFARVAVFARSKMTS
jgi:hypothetical protein